MAYKNDILKILLDIECVIGQIIEQYPNIEQFNYVKSVVCQIKENYLFCVCTQRNRDVSDLIIQQNYTNKLQHILSMIENQTSMHRIQTFDKQLQLQIQNIRNKAEDLLYKKYEELYCCGKTMTLRDSCYHCFECGQQQHMNKLLKMDKQETKKHSANHAALKHFDQCFKNIFFSCKDPIDTQIIDKIKKFMERDRKSKVSIEDIRQYLKQLSDINGPKYNRSDSQFLQIVNAEQMPKITIEEYKFIRKVYSIMIMVYYQINHQRDSIPNYLFFIKKIINFLYEGVDDDRKQQYSKLIFIQKENTINKINKKWNEICKHIDMKSLKTEFITKIYSQIQDQS